MSVIWTVSFMLSAVFGILGGGKLFKEYLHNYKEAEIKSAASVTTRLDFLPISDLIIGGAIAAFAVQLGFEFFIEILTPLIPVEYCACKWAIMLAQRQR